MQGLSFDDVADELLGGLGNIVVIEQTIIHLLEERLLLPGLGCLGDDHLDMVFEHRNIVKLRAEHIQVLDQLVHAGVEGVATRDENRQYLLELLLAHVVVEIDHNLRLHSSIVIKTAVVVDSEHCSMMIDDDRVNTACRGGDEVLLDLQVTLLVWICDIVQVLVFAVGGLQLVTTQERDN